MKEHDVELPPRTHRREPTRSRAGMWIIILVLIPLLYVLSLGPAAWLHSNTASEGVQSAIEMFYKPLALLVNYEVPGIAPALEWYVDWCDG